MSGIVTLQSGLPWFPDDVTNDLVGTGGFNGNISNSVQTWNYTGPVSAFKAGPQSIPCFGLLSGCTSAVIPPECVAAAQAPYAGNAPLMGLALAALDNLGCYEQGGGILTPPAFGTVGNASRNLFRLPPYYNVDFSVAKDWKFTERFSAEFRVEFFNLFNRADFAIAAAGKGGVDPSSGPGSQAKGFGCACQTPDVNGNNPVLGSGGPRHIQFGLKLLF